MVGFPDGRAHARGYGRSWSRGPRAVVLARDPLCVVCGVEPSTVADHHSAERVELIAAGQQVIG